MNDYSVNFKFSLPEFRVGTLDTLLALSDDLVKVPPAAVHCPQPLQPALNRHGGCRSTVFPERLLKGGGAGPRRPLRSARPAHTSHHRPRPSPAGERVCGGHGQQDPAAAV